MFIDWETYVTGPFVTTKGAAMVPLSASQDSPGGVEGVEVDVEVGPPLVCVGRGVSVPVAIGVRVGEEVGTGVPLALVVLTMNTPNSGNVLGGVTKPGSIGSATVHPLVGIETMQGGDAGHIPARGASPQAGWRFLSQ